MRANLPVVDASIEKRTPPEPDVLCRFEDGRLVAFELVEVCHPANAAFFGRVRPLDELLEATYAALLPDRKREFNARFAEKALSFTFSPDATIGRIRSILPRVFQELLDQPSGDDKSWEFSSAVQKVLSNVRFAGRAYGPDRPWFNLAGSFQSTDVVLDAILPKLKKVYHTPHPVELLAHFGPMAWGRSTSWEAPLVEALESSGLGPFGRVWVLAWSGAPFAYPMLSETARRIDDGPS